MKGGKTKMENTQTNQTYPKIREEIKKDITKRFEGMAEKARSGEEGLKWVTRWILDKTTEYKGTFDERLTKVLKRLSELQERLIQVQNDRLNTIAQAPQFDKPLIVSIQWLKNSTWGSNPRASNNKGFEGRGISGCGYCKRSTALAEGLNSDLSLIQELVIKEEARLNQHPTPSRRDFIGYGAGSQPIPQFEGGVGVTSLQGIIEGLGLTFETSIYTEKLEVYTINK